MEGHSGGRLVIFGSKIIASKDGVNPYLSETYPGQEPECAGADDTLIKDVSPATQTGQDMEGVFSRERFRVSDDSC
jgi:hypothetical protein